MIFYYMLSLFMGNGQIWTEKLSERDTEPKTTNRILSVTILNICKFYQFCHEVGADGTIVLGKLQVPGRPTNLDYRR